MRSRYFCSLLFLALISARFAAASTTETTYVWKSGDLFRYDYSKTVTVLQNDENGKPEERKTELAAVLILEVKNAPAGGTASGTLRFDSPRVTMPVLRTFSSQIDAPEVQADKNKTIARAMEGAIKVARWNVSLGTDGSIQITSRTPASLNDWLKDLSGTAGWRKKMAEQLGQLVEQDLGLKPQTTDREIFFCNSAGEAPSSPGVALHPVRGEFAPAAKPSGKVQVAFKRQFNAKSNTEFAVPNLVSPQPVTAMPQSVATAEGVAQFDTRLGMLDTMSEDYSVKMKYKCGAESIDQDVRVQYKLKRLAPRVE
jgi:hypothetical protein